MGRDIHTSIEIAARPEEVWEALIALECYSEWNPFIVAASGDLRRGSRLTLTMRAGAKTFTVRPKLVERTEGRALRWIGQLGPPGIFTAAHSHELEPTRTGVRYVQRERFTGILVPFLGTTLAGTAAAFEEMNHALKQRVEQRRAAARRRERAASPTAPKPC